MTIVVNWAKKHVELKTFRSRQDVWSFARRVTFILVPSAVFMNIVAHLIIDQLGLLPYPLLQAIAVGTVTAMGITSIVAMSFSVMMGSAILELTAERTEFERLSRTDMLSGLLNRRAFNEGCSAGSEGASLVIFDIDLFKRINDAYGHAAGDDVIVEVAARLKANFTESDLLARIGGEEFGVIVRDNCLDKRFERVDAARRAVAASTVKTGAFELTVTVSAGIADFVHEYHTDDIYRQADRALYLAKAQGRNRVLHEKQLDGVNVAHSTPAAANPAMTA